MIPVPMAAPSIGEDEIGAATRVLRSGMLAAGPAVKEFEEEFAEYCCTEQAIATNNGTSALHATLSCLGICPGNEVIIPDFSFIATATCVSMCGATPVFADVDERTFNISPESVLEAITPGTRAVIGVHLFGQPFQCDPLREICDDHDLFLIEDAAQSHGARYRGKMTGGLGDAACFSFYPTKNMTTGEGGMITTGDRRFADRVRAFINHGQSRKYVHEFLGYNYRMTDIAAAIGSVQLRRLDAFNRKRIENAGRLDRCLGKTAVLAPFRETGVGHVYHQYVTRVTGGCGIGRDNFARELRARGIDTAVHYPTPIHLQPVYQGVSNPVPCPVSERLSNEVLSLPVHPRLTTDQIEYMCSTIEELF
ncbi:MAG: DegT/DnrJ/EryC1/StrS family aminotransferase [Methanoregulaceae archaeon]|nr:DegT/DnrJ/EryC1/StrS family aminotransferase [Methanoregulaceae archaeon]